MADEVAVIDQSLLPVAVADNVTDDAFDSVSSSSAFLPRFNLYGSNSGPVKEDKIGAGRYGFNQGTNIVDCGKDVQAIVLGLRLKALEINGDSVTAFFTPTHPEFQRIRALSDVKDSECLCGPEFLLYLPIQKQFVTFYMASKTMKKEAPNVRQYLGKAITLKSQLIKKGKYAWHGPIVTGCSIELEPPPRDKLLVELEKFKLEKDSDAVPKKPETETRER